MIVKMQSKGCEVIGLQVDETDVQRYFPERISVIELQLDHLQIQCGLRPDFWQGHAEIRDPRLTAWFTQKNFNRHMGMMPLPLAMIPSGEALFELRVLKGAPIEKRRRRLARHEGRFVRDSTREGIPRY